MQIQNKNYKDTVFRRLFSDKANLLELYNAINKTNYTDPDALTIKTLKGMVFLNMKNDVSFLIDYEINLYEHNSTLCPNIPLRDLFYIASSYKKMVHLKDTYKSELLQIPAPRFFVFYNGNAPLPDKKEYRLSDIFMKKTKKPELELVVTALNINEGRNQELMQSCKTLKEYSIFVSKVRKYTHKAKLEHSKEEYDKNKKGIIEQAVTTAIDECIKEDVLRDFFVVNRKEAIDMCSLECTAEEQLQVFADEAYDKGLAQGISQGITQGVSQGITSVNELYSWLFENGRSSDVLRATSDSDYIDDLFKEYKDSVGIQ